MGQPLYSKPTTFDWAKPFPVGDMAHQTSEMQARSKRPTSRPLGWSQGGGLGDCTQGLGRGRVDLSRDAIDSSVGISLMVGSWFKVGEFRHMLRVGHR